MTHRMTITLDDEAFTFLNRVASDNRSAYINQLLKQARQECLKADLLQANQEEAADTHYQEVLPAWDRTLSDGLAHD